MNSLSLLNLVSRFGALALSLFCLLGLSSQAQAGYWGTPTYVWSGTSHLKDIRYGGPYTQEQMYSVTVATTNLVCRNGQLVNGIDAYPDRASVIWHDQGQSPAADKVENYATTTPNAATSFANSSVYAVLKWHRNTLGETQVPDPTDNPPQYLYVSEQVNLRGERSTFADSGYLPAYDGGTPWSGDFVTVNGHAGSRDLQVSLGAGGWHYARVSSDVGTFYGYTNSVSQVKIHRYAVAGDTVSLGSVSFSGTATVGTGYEHDHKQGTGNVSFGYSVKPLSLSFTATPVGPYSVTVNTPLNKVYEAYTRWGARYSTDGTMTVEPFVSAQSAFALTAKTGDNQEALQNPTYQWTSSAPTYIPVLPPAEIDENYTILLQRQALQFADDASNTMANALPPIIGIPMRSTPPSGLVPEWFEHFEWQTQLALATGQFPPEWDIHTSTPTKTLFWSNGNHVQKIPPTTVTVKATDSKGAVVDGKIQINWHRPAQTVYDINLLPVEWQIAPPEDQPGGNAGNFIYTALSDDKLLSDIGKDAVVQAATIVATEVGGRVLRVVFTKRVGAAFVARFFAMRAAAAGIEVTAAQAATIAENVGQATVRATEIAESGAAVETATSTQPVHLGSAPPNGEAATTRPLVPEGEPTTTCKGDTCFVAGTPVVIADGSTKPIESVKVGDLVLSRDPSTGQVASKKVTRTYVRQAPSTVVLGLGDGQKVEVTPEHPVFVPVAGHGPRWKMVPACHVAIGTSIQTRAGPPLKLATLTAHTASQTVFNFTVDQFHTYFVGKSQDHALWVHNANPDDYDLSLTQEGVPDPTGEGDTGANEFSNAEEAQQQLSSGAAPVLLDPSAEAFFEEARPQLDDIFDSIRASNRGNPTAFENTNGFDRTLATSRVKPGIELPDGATTPDFSPSLSGDHLQAKSYSLNGKTVSLYNKTTGFFKGIVGGDQFHAEIKMSTQWYEWLRSNPNVKEATFQLAVRNTKICGSCKSEIQFFVDYYADAEGRNITVEALTTRGGRKEIIRFRPTHPPVSR